MGRCCPAAPSTGGFCTLIRLLMPTVCITHPLTPPLREDISAALTQLTQAGFTVHGTPGKKVTPLPITPAPLPLNDLPHTGWVFTSQHGVQHLFDALAHQNIALTPPNPHHIMAVGPQTRALLHQHGWATHHASQTLGSSQALGNTLATLAATQAEFIPAHWVWPCSTHRHDDWLAHVTHDKTGLIIHPWVVYTAQAIPTLPTAHQQQLAESDALLITSPGHLEGLLTQHAPLPPNLIAIGPTTAGRILTLTGRPAAAVANTPTWAAMAHALQTL